MEDVVNVFIATTGAERQHFSAEFDGWDNWRRIETTRNFRFFCTRRPLAFSVWSWIYIWCHGSLRIPEWLQSINGWIHEVHGFVREMPRSSDQVREMVGFIPGIRLLLDPWYRYRSMLWPQLCY